jgi:hypothetical protein
MASQGLNLNLEYVSGEALRSALIDAATRMSDAKKNIKDAMADIEDEDKYPFPNDVIGMELACYLGTHIQDILKKSEMMREFDRRDGNSMAEHVRNKMKSLKSEAEAEALAEDEKTEAEAKRLHVAGLMKQIDAIGTIGASDDDDDENEDSDEEWFDESTDDEFEDQEAMKQAKLYVQEAKSE